ncbi:Rieske [2Fe-2S] domain-containing protein [Faunimonas pinastri]|uniref:Rieske [2Fe-2S] domain-containing protein n=1 Tax=Faunimonas pinastri TaxID=1855383 RepID=A0A1H9F8D2_9HYPH|nr:FAD-dependent oxidoreductase [Faunimonas pinastri]SEQ34210.1 Rieske [2Fe-2S] domain-containing protein [Faunimonas pinastri]
MASENQQEKPDLAKGIASADLTEGQMLVGTLDGEDVLVARSGGKLFALGAKCTHLGAPLAKGIMVHGELRCPWHHARFSLETGEAVSAPALDPVGCFRAEESDGRIVVGKGRETISRPAPEKTLARRVVIVGGGAAGHACAEMLARSAFPGSVTMISNDSDAPYDRTFCSKQYLAGKVSRENAALADKPLYAAGEGEGKGEGGIALRLKTNVEAIDPAAKEITLSGGERIGYDALVLATGAEPQRPDIPGFERPNVYVLRTLADADALIEAAEKASRVAVIGASYIGLEVAASMIGRKLQVDVISPDEVPVGKTLGIEGGKFVQGLHEKKGVTFHLGRKVKGFDGRTLTLDDGSKLEADFVVAGTGVAPRAELAEAAGLKVASKEKGGGVVVNGRLETSAEGIYAAGDIARYPDPHGGGHIRVEHWVHAERQGQHVARLLMGATGDFRLPPFFWSAHYGTSLRYVGHAGKQAEPRLEGSVEDGEFAIRFFDEGKESALATCKKDKLALEVEAEWEQV